MALIGEEKTHAILGACFEVYRELGAGFLEDPYQESLEIEFESRGIPFQSQKSLPIFYKGKQLRKGYIADFVCYEDVIVEIKAVKAIDDAHRAQIMNYLRASNFRFGLLVNFGHHPKAQFERFII
jgi:GxxExxY protein